MLNRGASCIVVCIFSSLIAELRNKRTELTHGHFRNEAGKITSLQLFT